MAKPARGIITYPGIWAHSRATKAPVSCLRVTSANLCPAELRRVLQTETDPSSVTHSGTTTQSVCLTSDGQCGRVGHLEVCSWRSSLCAGLLLQASQLWSGLNSGGHKDLYYGSSDERVFGRRMEGFYCWLWQNQTVFGFGLFFVLILFEMLSPWSCFKKDKFLTCWLTHGTSCLSQRNYPFIADWKSYFSNHQMFVSGYS